ncbi:hypothetical protein M0802_006771 [Mischocyttarus mexicanus]|nr:hypothetical protein M0802_006771 [Mischocyttarus mexicanus]
MSLRHVEREDASGLTQTCRLPPEIRRPAHVAAVLGSPDNGLINFTLIPLLINGDLVIVGAILLFQWRKLFLHGPSGEKRSVLFSDNLLFALPVSLNPSTLEC